MYRWGICVHLITSTGPYFVGHRLAYVVQYWGVSSFWFHDRLAGMLALIRPTCNVFHQDSGIKGQELCV